MTAIRIMPNGAQLEVWSEGRWTHIAVDRWRTSDFTEEQQQEWLAYSDTMARVCFRRGRRKAIYFSAGHTFAHFVCPRDLEDDAIEFALRGAQ